MTLTRDQQRLLRTSVSELVRGLEVELEIRQEQAVTKGIPDQGGDQSRGNQEAKPAKSPQRWITIRGRHIPLFAGEKVEDALARHFGRKGGRASDVKDGGSRPRIDADHRRLEHHLTSVYPEPGTPLWQNHLQTEQLAEMLHGPESTVGLAHNPADKTYVAHSTDDEGIGRGYSVGKTPEEALSRHRDWVSQQIRGQLDRQQPGAAVASQQYGVDDQGHLAARRGYTAEETG